MPNGISWHLPGTETAKTCNMMAMAGQAGDANRMCVKAIGCGDTASSDCKCSIHCACTMAAKTGSKSCIQKPTIGSVTCASAQCAAGAGSKAAPTLVAIIACIAGVAWSTSQWGRSQRFPLRFNFVIRCVCVCVCFLCLVQQSAACHAKNEILVSYMQWRGAIKGPWPNRLQINAKYIYIYIYVKYMTHICQIYLSSFIWGSLFNSRHPDPRRVWKGWSEQHLLTPLLGAPRANSKKLCSVDGFMNLTHFW
jgi:hypothetical protein